MKKALHKLKVTIHIEVLEGTTVSLLSHRSHFPCRQEKHLICKGKDWDPAND